MSFRSIREWAGRNPRTVAAIATASTAVTWFTSQHAEQISNNAAEVTTPRGGEGHLGRGHHPAREKVSDLCEKLPALTGMIRPQRRIQRRAARRSANAGRRAPGGGGRGPGRGSRAAAATLRRGRASSTFGPLPTSRTIADFYVGQRGARHPLAALVRRTRTGGRGVSPRSRSRPVGTVSVDYDDGDHDDGVYLCFVVCAFRTAARHPTTL